MKAKKIMAVLVIAIMLIGIVSVPVLASTNEKVILKNSDNEYLIYFKEFCRKEFQFAISKDSKTAEADLNFVNSAKDQPASAAGTLNVAYIDEASFESIFGKNPTSLVAYIWVKDAEDNTVIKADKLDLNEAVTDKMIETVNGTTKRIDVDTEKLTFTCKKAAKKPFAFPGELEKRNFVFEPEKTRSVDASALIQADFYGIEIENGRCLPGPFAELDPNRIYDIDPRKK